VFSLAHSLTRDHFKEEEPKWVMMKPAVGEKWSACLQALEGHTNAVSSAAFSHDSVRLASASYDRTVKIWDTRTSECLQTLDIGKKLYNVAFDTTGSYLHTNIGTIVIDALASNMTLNATDPQFPDIKDGL
jgi:WD40 repeat protein